MTAALIVVDMLNPYDHKDAAPLTDCGDGTTNESAAR